jgi:hypothetical protein
LTHQRKPLTYILKLNGWLIYHALPNKNTKSRHFSRKANKFQQPVKNFTGWRFFAGENHPFFAVL